VFAERPKVLVSRNASGMEGMQHEWHFTANLPEASRPLTDWSIYQSA
jgi:hypothetical protein